MEIIHTSEIKKILDYDDKGTAHFFLPLCEISKNDLDHLMLKRFKKISAVETDDAENIFLEKEYINNVSRLSLEFNSLQWWANPVSEKNEHTSTLYKNLCLFYSLIKTLHEFVGTDKVIFVFCSNELFYQLREHCDKNNIKIRTLGKQPDAVSAISQRLWHFLYRFVFFLKVIFRKTFTSLKLRRMRGNLLDPVNTYYVIRTWLDSRLLKEGWTGKDAYFGVLPGYIKGQGYPLLILAGVLNSYTKVIGTIKDAKDSLILPEELFLKYTDILSSFFFFNPCSIGPGKKILFGGIDVTCLFKNEISKGYRSIEYRQNLIRYYIAKRFSETVRFSVYLHTFENYAWEKVSILGIREGRENGSIYGFQHAFISRNSFKYFPGKEEIETMPLPDRIITMGEVTKKILLKYGAYHKNTISTGCALRQGYLEAALPSKRRGFKKILVPLTMVKEESLAVFDFLYRSGLCRSDFKVVIRCHPAASFETFKDRLDFKVPDNFIISNEKDVSEELNDADMVLYTWTTVAVEALKLGLPVIYLDILRPMYVDPLFECNALKKSVSNAEDLMPAIEGFYGMDDRSFYSEQLEALEYLKEYFYPVTDKALKSAFIPQDR